MVRATLFRCCACRRQTSATAGTIFQDTRKPLVTWFRAMWYVTSQKNGASALGLQRVLGLGSYETAWTWLHKLRRAMVRPDRDRLKGWIEVDETMVGGLAEGVSGRQTESKALVVIAAEADGPGIGRIRMRVIEDASAASLHPFVQRFRRAGKYTPHRRLARLLGTGAESVSAGDHSAAGTEEGSFHTDAARSPHRRVAEAVAARYPPRRRGASTPGLLPG